MRINFLEYGAAILGLLVLAPLGGCSQAASSTADQGQRSAEGRVIEFRDAEGALPSPLGQGATDARAVRVDLAELDQALTAGGGFDIRLLGRTFRLAPAGQPFARAQAWTTEVAEVGGDRRRGTAILIRRPTSLFLRLYVGNRAYEVASERNGTLTATEINVDALPDESPTEPRPGAFDDLPEADPRAAVEDIDVLLLYDPALKARLDARPDGFANFLLERQRLLTLAYAEGRNGLPVRVNIVGHALYTGRVSTNISNQSRYLRDWRDFARRRDEVGADLVALMVSDIRGSCGIAPVYDNGQDYAARSVTDYDCEYKYTAAHEIGHNLGAGHVRGGGTTTQRCNFGYRIPNVARDLMAYECSGNSCPRMPYFSDARLREQGQVMGRTCGQRDGAENVLTVRRTIPVVARFRTRP